MALQQAKWAEKLAEAGVGVSIYAADLASLEFDLMKTPAYIEFTKITFPVFLKYYDPAYPFKLAKVTTTDETRRVTLTGDGLYKDGVNPTIELAALDKDGKYQPYTLSADKIHKGNGSIWFDIPFSWMDTGSDIVGPVYFQLNTSFTDSVTGNQINVKVPASFRDEHYKVFLDMGLSITSFSKNKVNRGEDLTIYGKGFSITNAEIKIDFTDHNGQTIEVTPSYSYSNYLETKVPQDLAFGNILVQIKMNDLYKSNVKDLTLIPKIVTASPGDRVNAVDFKDTVQVSLSQSEGVPIMYYLGTSDKSHALAYTSPITLNKTTTIYPFARAVVGGLNYDSDIIGGGYAYYKCADDEEFKDGECVRKVEDSVVKNVDFSIDPGDESIKPHTPGVYLTIPLHVAKSGNITIDYKTNLEDIQGLLTVVYVQGTGSWDGERLILDGTFTYEIKDLVLNDGLTFTNTATGSTPSDCVKSEFSQFTFHINTRGYWNEPASTTSGIDKVTAYPYDYDNDTCEEDKSPIIYESTNLKPEIRPDNLEQLK